MFRTRSRLVGMVVLVSCLMWGGFALCAQNAEPYDRDQLVVQGQALIEQAKSAKDGLAFSILQRHTNSYTELVVRAKTGLAEQHADWSDFMIGLEGEVTIVVGGEVVDGKDTAPGEIRGSEVRGGERYLLAPGKMLRVPAGTPHQAILADGHTCKYLVIKIADKKNP